VRQLLSTNSHCTRCGYIPTAPIRAPKGEGHKYLDASEKEYKALMKMWNQSRTPNADGSTQRTVYAIVKLSMPATHRRQYLSYRACVDADVQSSGCAKYLHGGEGNELRRFYPATYLCEFGGRGGFAPCIDPSCTVCNVAQYGPSGSALGFSNADRCVSQCYTNACGVNAVFVCRVVVGNAYHSEFSTTAPEGHHSTVTTFPSAGPAPTPKHPNAFFPAVVDDSILVSREVAVDPIFLILCS